ncbi:MAG TPA: hypothetical protein VK053_10705 [Jiangellaceae bacterium]|jgi:hypothetical protein|nr:hypothetical protein [Jiangellaceae bacterium]
MHKQEADALHGRSATRWGAAVRAAAEEILERSRALPAPCGCTPTARCDRHCRVKIHPTRDLQGHRSWSAECDGRGNLDYPHDSSRVRCGDLWTLHDWATEHVARHRLAAFTRTE